MSDEGFISRWSRKKTEAKSASTAGPHRLTADAVPAQAGTQSPAGAQSPPPEVAADEPLPPIESLTTDSDFTPFMKPGVDASTRREAVKVLLRDPRFNVMDGLDVYIDDYSKPDPLPDGWLEKMTQVVRLGEYRDPDRQAPEPDAENAEKTARQDQAHADAHAENDVRDQPLAKPEAFPAADTPDEGSADAKVQESPPPQ